MNLPDSVAEFLKNNAPNPPLQDGDLTAYVASEEWKISRSAAASRLDLMVSDGKLDKIYKSRNGKNIAVYVPR